MICWFVHADAFFPFLFSFFFSSKIDIQSRKLYLCEFSKNMFDIGLCSNTYSTMSFSHGMMINMTTLYILISV